MFGILNWKDLPASELAGVESLAINPKEKIYLFVDIPAKYEYTIIDRFAEVDVVTVKPKQVEKDLPIFSKELIRQYGTDSLKQYLPLKELTVFGKNIILCVTKDIHLEEYAEFFKVVLGNNAPASVFSRNGNDNFTTTFSPSCGKFRAIVYNTAQVLPIALYAKSDCGQVLVMQGDNHHAYFSFRHTIGSLAPETMAIYINEFANCKENIREKSNGAGKYLKDKLFKKQEELQVIIDDIEEITNTAKRTIVENTRKIPRILESINIVEKDLENAEIKINEGLEKIKNLPDVEDAFMSEMILIVKTKKLHAITTMPSGDKRDVYYGKFTLLVNMENAIVYAVNEEFNYAGKDHPHGFLAKNLCLGSISHDISFLVGNFDLVNIVAIMIDFLRSANKSDCEGCKVASWPYIDSKTKTINPNKASVYNPPLTLEES